MIGTKIRGFRHLIKMAKTLNEVGLFFKHDYFNIGHGVALYVSSEDCKNPYMSSNSDYVMLFNDLTSNVKFNPSYHVGTKISDKIQILSASYPYLWVLPVDKKNFGDDAHMFTHKICVPEDFEAKYKEFCESNKKQMPNATKYVEINSAILKYLFAISNGSKNFFFWAVNAMYKQGVSIYLIERLLAWNDKYNQLSSKLKKGTITGYTGSHDFFALAREMSKLRRDKRANDVINMFNTTQKKLLKGVSLNDRDYETLSKFAKLSGKKKVNFIRKMSTVEDAGEILKQMSFLADVHFEWKKESLLDFIKNADNFNCEIVIDRDNIVLLKVNDYETVKRLAKTTNWCISKDKKYWNEYVENNSMATQYVLLDFSRKEDDNLSIVGFTSVHDRGITNAHDFQNKNLMEGRRTNTVSEIKSFVSKFIDCRNIFGVLDKYGIKLSDVVSYEPNQYKWDRENMFKYLNQCISEDDYYIIADYGDKVALIAEDDNVRYFLGDTYIEERGRRGIFGNQHIIFADFTKKHNDPEKLVFGVITHNFEEHESYCARLFNDRFEAINQSFDSKLEEFGLPYDIICRKDNVIERFYNSLSTLELATVKDLIQNKKVKDSLKRKERSGLVRDSLTNVTFMYNSSDYIDLFYNEGLTLSDVIGPRNAGDCARRMANNMFDTGRHGYSIEIKVPNASEIENFIAGKSANYNEAYYVGNFMMLMKFIDKENDKDAIYRLVSSIYDRHFVCDLFDLVFTRLFEKIDVFKSYESAKLIAAYAYNQGSPRVVNAIESKKEKNPSLEEFIIRLNKPSVKTTEMWVRREDGTYVVDNATVNEEVVAHAPRRR